MSDFQNLFKGLRDEIFACSKPTRINLLFISKRSANFGQSAWDWITEHSRALAVKDGSDFIWFWVGKHDEYDRLIRS